MTANLFKLAAVSPLRKERFHRRCAPRHRLRPSAAWVPGAFGRAATMRIRTQTKLALLSANTAATAAATVTKWASTAIGRLSAVM